MERGYGKVKREVNKKENISKRKKASYKKQKEASDKEKYIALPASLPSGLNKHTNNVYSAKSTMSSTAH